MRQTKQIKVAEATDMQLDWLVATCQGRTPSLHEYSKREGRWFILMQTGMYRTVCAFSTEWSQMGPIIDREEITIDYRDSETQARKWTGDDFIHALAGKKRGLIAAARCYVASKLGETVEVPEELT